MKVEELPVYQKSFELLLHIMSCTKNFQREFKFLLGDRINKEMFDLMDFIYKANVSFKKEIRKEKIMTAIEKLKLLELKFRLSKELQLVSIKQYSSFILLSDEIGKQLYGWKKSCGF